MGLAAADVGQELAQAVAPGRLLAGEQAAAHQVAGVRARFVAEPTTVTGVSRVLAVAASRQLAVAPTGAGARLGWGAPPRRLDVVLSLARLDHVLAHEPADLTLSVECGMTLEALDAVLRPHRQFVPLDPARPHASTIGGLIATGAAGPYRARYGTMRDLLVGLTVVRADGTVVKGGGRVVKNVTGYDIPKLHVGALGTLGVVVEAHLRLHPRPAEERSWAFGFASSEAALEAALDVRDTPVVLSRCQIVTAGALRALGEAAPPGALLAVTIGSVPEAVRAQGAQVSDVCRRAGSPGAEIPEADAWWRRVTDVTWPENPTTDLALRIGTRPTDTVKALRSVEAVPLGAGELRATIDVASGVLHATVACGETGRVRDTVRQVRDAAATLGGTSVVEHAPPETLSGLDVWGPVGPAIEPMRRLKRELDPTGVLNPGRYVGGI
ncbi:MAG TPA: FAD-binding oxidoreductase [Methylomirabilota bacterium]|nr:FAD-binding oxidoreductase [Methylomirabilota bacterium]